MSYEEYSRLTPDYKDLSLDERLERLNSLVDELAYPPKDGEHYETTMLRIREHIAMIGRLMIDMDERISRLEQHRGGEDE